MTKKLIEALDGLIAEKRSSAQNLFLRFLREVWQIDDSISPSDVWARMAAWDLAYFRPFMIEDTEDASEDPNKQTMIDQGELQLLIEWISTRVPMRKAPGIKEKDLISTLNQLRDSNKD